MNLIQTNAASAFPLCIHLLSHGFTFHCVRKWGISGCTVKEQWNVPARDREWALSRHPSWHKWLPVFAFTQYPQPQPSSFHPRFHLLFFPFFLSISSSVSPSWVTRPFAWPCLTFPSSTHSHIRTSLSYLSPTTRTDWTSHMCGMKTNGSCPWHNCKWAALSFCTQ